MSKRDSDPVGRIDSFRRDALASLRKEEKALRKARKLHKAAVEAQQHVQKVAAAVQQKVHRQIAAVVSKCLRSVYGTAYDFEIEFTRKRGKTGAVLWLIKDGHRTDPKDDSGGVRDVVALGLRVAQLLLERPAKEKVLILDEPFKGIHGEEYQRRAAKLIETLASEMDIQFVIISGLKWLREIGKVVHL